jgi:hypothetical protein
MESNLVPNFIDFINNGGNVNNLVQQIIDRAQYHPKFLQELFILINKYEEPFEHVSIDEQIEEGTTEIYTRKLKPEFCK